MRKRALAGVLLFAPELFGQLSTNSVTVTASNTATLQPDQIVYSVVVSSGLSASFDQVLAAVQGLGITAANFTGVSGQGVLSVDPVISSTPPASPTVSSIIWSFTLPAPLVNNTATVAQLTNFQQALAKQNDGLTMSFSIQGTQISQQLQASQPCVLANLLAQARTQAQSLATAAGFNLGVIQAMSSTITTAVSVQGQNSSSSVLGSASAPCTVTVKFGINNQ
jgi:hypothetical protein